MRGIGSRFSGEKKHRHHSRCFGHDDAAEGHEFLSAAENGRSVRVIHVLGGIEARRKLLDLGIVPGEGLRVIKNDPEGPLLISVRNTTMMIGRGLAEKIRVTAC